MERRNFLLFLPWIAAASTLRSRIVVPDLTNTYTFPPETGYTNYRCNPMLKLVCDGWHKVEVVGVTDRPGGVVVRQRLLDGSGQEVVSYFSQKAPQFAVPMVEGALGRRLGPGDETIDMNMLIGKKFYAQVGTDEFKGTKRNVVKSHMIENWSEVSRKLREG